MDEIIKKLNKMETEFSEFKKYTESIIMINTTLVQEIANQINTKIDILCNLDNANNNAGAKAPAKKNKALTKSAFFKDKLKNNMDEFIDDLYTKEEIDALYNNDEVKIKKTDLQKKTKIIDILYLNITKNDATKNNKLKLIYDEYKKVMEQDDDEETKSEN